MHIYFAPLEGITTYPYRNLHHILAVWRNILPRFWHRDRNRG